jgi:hypothetical protein
MVPTVGWIRRRGWGHSSWLVTVITLPASLEVHDMVGVVGTRVPRELLLRNCFKVWIVSIVFCWHHLFGDDKVACVFFIMLCFPILNLSHLQRGKKWLIAKSYNSIALSLWQDQNEISKCIQEAQFHLRQPLHNTPPYPITYPPIHVGPTNSTDWPVTQRAPPPSYPIQSPPTQVVPNCNPTWPPTPPPQ